MARVLLVTLLISILWIQIGVAFKCYFQRCLSTGDGYECNAGKEGTEMEGDVDVDEIGCYERHQSREGKLWLYERMGIQREGFDSSEKDKLAEGCVTRKDGTTEYTQCYCFKDLCNTKYKIPPGAKSGPAHIMP